MTELLWFRILVALLALGSITGLMTLFARSLRRLPLPEYCRTCARDHAPGEACPCSEGWTPKEAA